jgi:hypothetical protein
MVDRDSEARLAIKRDFAAFLDAEGGGTGASSAAGGLYAAKIGARLDVDLQDLAGVAPELHARLMDDPADCIPAFEEVRLMTAVWSGERQGERDRRWR